MFDGLAFLVLALGFSLVASPILAIAAHSRISTLRGEIASLKRKIDILAKGTPDEAEAGRGQTESPPPRPEAIRNPFIRAPENPAPESPAPENPAPETPVSGSPAAQPSPTRQPTGNTNTELSENVEETQQPTQPEPFNSEYGPSLEEPNARREADQPRTERRQTDQPQPDRPPSGTEQFGGDNSNRTPPPAAPLAAAPSDKDAEQKFATQWLVWLGGLTITLGGVFLVKYGIEHGFITPALRVAAGLVLSLVLVIGGERLRQKHAAQAAEAPYPDFVPQALTGAGVAIAFGSLYAGYGLHGLLNPLVAFIALALVCVGALGLSLLQGPFVAVLGVIGGMAVPALVQTTTPNAWGLFAYITAIGGAAFWITRYKDWWWLAMAAILGSAIWQVLWLIGGPSGQSLLPVYLHAVATFGMIAAMRAHTSFGPPANTMTHIFDMAGCYPVQRFVITAASILAGPTMLILFRTGHAMDAVLFTGVMTALFGACALRGKVLDALLPVSAALTLAGLFTWLLPNQSGYLGLSLFDNSNTAELAQLPFTPEFQIFGICAAIAALWFAGLGYAGIRFQARKDLWAGISGGMPLAIFMLAYAKLDTLLPEMLWAGTAMAMAAGAIAAAQHCMGKRTEPLMESAVGLYALTALSAIALSLTILLDGSWLTIAISGMILAAAWVNQRFDIAALRPATGLAALVVLGRLALLNQIPPFLSIGPERDAVWILYSYGIPALAFAAAARLFHRQKDDGLVTLLESGAIAFTTALINLQIREFFGDLTSIPGKLTLTEISLHSLSWMMSGMVLYYRNIRRPRAVHQIAGNLLLGLAGVTVVALQVLWLNPFTGQAVGGVPVFNTLLIAYLAPALFAAGFTFLEYRNGVEKLWRPALIAAGALAFLWVNFEVRHLFHGTRLDIGPTTDAELYTYSIVWLLCAAPALILGLTRDIRVLRRVGLGLVLLTVGKVFLIDMSGLDGLYRVFSFLGLGFCLVGIGYLYQRVFK